MAYTEHGIQDRIAHTKGLIRNAEQQLFELEANYRAASRVAAEHPNERARAEAARNRDRFRAQVPALEITIASLRDDLAALEAEAAAAEPADGSEG
jgi:chromosome segregation ATPase